jgi:recombination DNA repair RAD52 pathway protein
VLLRCSERETKVRRFLGLDRMTALDWTDAPTTAAEEASWSPKILSDISIEKDDTLAVPLLSADLECTVEAPGEGALLALKAMKYKEEKEDDDEDDPVEEFSDDSVSNDSVSKCSLDTRGYCKYHSAGRNNRVRVPKVQFVTLPTTTVGEDSDDDDTLSMDTADKKAYGEEFNRKHP